MGNGNQYRHCRGRYQWAMVLTALCLGAATSMATVSNWSTNNTTAGAATNDLNLAAGWSNGFSPAAGNGFDVFMVWSRPSGGAATTKILTNATTDIFVADSLTLTNTGKDNVFVTFNGPTYLTNGTGHLNMAGSTGTGDITLTFSNIFQFTTVSFRDSNGGGVARLNLAGNSTGQDFNFIGGAGKNQLVISGPLTLTGTLAVTNLNLNQGGTLSGNAAIHRLLINNLTNERYTFTNSTTTLTGAVESRAGGFTLANNATLALNAAGILTFTNTAPLIRGTIVLNAGTLNSRVAWTNAGTVTLGSGTVAGEPFHNAGWLRGPGTVVPALVNSGTIVLPAGTTTFADNLTLTPSGVLVGDAGSTLRLRGDFVNGSALAAAFDLRSTTVRFDAGGLSTQMLTLAGLDFGTDAAGWSNNFAFGALVIGNGLAGRVQLVGGATNALYVENLTVAGGAELLLNGRMIYTLNEAVLEGTVVTGGGAIVLIPEPSAVVLVVVGLALSAVMVRRRG